MPAINTQDVANGEGSTPHYCNHETKHRPERIPSLNLNFSKYLPMVPHPTLEHHDLAVRHRKYVLSNCPQPHQVLDPSLEDQELESASTIDLDLREEHSTTSLSPTHARPEVRINSRPKNILLRIYKFFQDAESSIEESSDADSALDMPEMASRALSQNAPVIYEGRHFLSLQTDLTSCLQTAEDNTSLQDEAIFASPTTERGDLSPEEEESLRVELAQLLASVRNPSISFLQDTSTHTRTSINDETTVTDNTENSDAGSSTQTPTTPQPGCLYHKCQLYNDSRMQAGRYVVSLKSTIRACGID
jgi:hypothetical protein